MEGVCTEQEGVQSGAKLQLCGLCLSSGRRRTLLPEETRGRGTIPRLRRKGGEGRGLGRESSLLT